MAIVLPEDPQERLQAMLKLVRGQRAEYTVQGTKYVVEPRAPERLSPKVDSAPRK